PEDSIRHCHGSSAPVRRQPAAHGTGEITCPEVVEIIFRIAFFATEAVMIRGIVRRTQHLFAKWIERAIGDYRSSAIGHDARRAEMIALIVLGATGVRGSVLGDSLARKNVVRPGA